MENEERPEFPDAVYVNDCDDNRWVIWAIVGLFLSILIGTALGIYLIP